MSLILCIETATPVCSVALGENGSVVTVREKEIKNAHSELLTVLIQDMMNEAGKSFTELAAVAVSKGPGSYTGLRIGVSAAKGFCYALGIPLISVGTLQAMAIGMSVSMNEKNLCFCPMIDARRMEVYCALFDNEIKEILETRAEIITANSFSEHLDKSTVYFFGDGAAKCKGVIENQNARFTDDFKTSAEFLIPIALTKFRNKQFENTAYFEPFYLKDFIPGIPKVKGLQ
ncbi:MAG: tRNA (adenosine(37)-N6)-threonylcarbamoyltransferase complex dimerization subunit type 1 TsaB [Bacteroidetes bacterium]|nr:tRNA (adenosine(37)-N6)-threonylcarbamoyltransferase complex dimerization subunit type 1 TsaB [Bacteroidota bacterium]